MSEGTKVFSSGMQRSADADQLAFTLIHPIMTISLAKTLAEGAAKYNRMNWELGSSVEDNINHVLRHLCLYLSGDRSEPHLEHAFCDMGFAVVESVLRPDGGKTTLRGPGCTLTPDILNYLESGKADRQKRREAGEFSHLGTDKIEDIPEIRRILEDRRDRDKSILQS